MKALCYKMLLFITLSFLSIGSTLSQVNWTKYPGNPVTELTGFLHHPCVLFNANSNRFEMWFSFFLQSQQHISFAYSEDGIFWTIHPTPVLTRGPLEWDAATVESPFVIWENGQYKMWYSGSTNWLNYKIGYATSPDGITWTKYVGNPIFDAGANSWETGGVHGCSILPLEGGYKMWYSGLDTTTIQESIGCATSSDGIFWQRDTLNNPVLEPSASGWDSVNVFYPSVILIDDLYYMWYGGEFDTSGRSIIQLGLATSSDGVSWNKHWANPVLSPSPFLEGGWENGSVRSGSVILLGDTLYMWYNGSSVPLCGGKSDASIGLAKSFFEPVPVEVELGALNSYFLEQNFPNPFNPSTKIEYSIPQLSNVVMKVFDVLGNEIETLVSEEKPTGAYELNWNAQQMPSGIYFYQLRAGSFIETKKMILLK